MCGLSGSVERLRPRNERSNGALAIGRNKRTERGSIVESILRASIIGF